MFSTIGCDQLTKVVARDTLSVSGPLTYLQNTIVLEHAENPGAFMSMGATLHKDMRLWIFTFGVLIFLAATLVILLRNNKMDKWTTIATTLLVAGGIGNLIDRIDRGTVTDFINIGLGSWRTGIFNVADMAVVAGVLILAIPQLCRSISRAV